MNKLWAPWRITYVSNTRAKGCILCKAFKEKKDKRNLVVLRSKHSFAILNTFPYNNGHVMVVSNRHVSSIEKLKDKEILDINKVLIKMLAALKATLKPAGFNVGINLGKVSGAGIDKHLHIHIVPRWLGDTNFMPVLSDTKIISQSLSELYKKLIKHTAGMK
ncbi:MAG: HIT domain-containing protein [Candidatus Omnitrophica bacterium]|nr:HIT domain-containing protein [Candidatus Omnitrophota bacterium]